MRVAHLPRGSGRAAAVVSAGIALMPGMVGGQTQLSTLTAPEGTKLVEIYADGAIRGVALGEGDNSPAGTGSLGIRVALPNKVYFAVVNVASTIDTITTGAGAFILSPSNGAALRSGLLDLHFPNVLNRLFNAQVGLHTYGSASQAAWRGGKDAASTVVVGLGALLYHNVISGWIGDDARNRTRLSFEVGPSARIIAGDLHSSVHDDLRAELIGTRSTFIGGLELGLQIEFGVVTAAFQFYHL